MDEIEESKEEGGGAGWVMTFMLGILSYIRKITTNISNAFSFAYFSGFPLFLPLQFANRFFHQTIRFLI